MAFHCNNYVISIFIITICCAICQGRAPSRIVGGTSTSIYMWPSMVSLRYNEKHMCGGALITKCHVLTAAHCVFHMKVKEMKIATGSADQITFKNFYEIKKIDIHAKYIGESNSHLDDIAVIELQRCIVEGPTQKVAQLYKSPLGDHVVGTVIGWGQLHNDIHITARFLQQINSWTINNNECSKSYYPGIIHPTHVCTKSAPNAGFCNGDSGGPFFVDDKIAGIVSMGAKCGAGIPDIYTRVYDYISWIKSKIHQ